MSSSPTSSQPNPVLTPVENDEKHQQRLCTDDLLCQESMSPVCPVTLKIPVKYPWKLTYCGSELVYSPEKECSETFDSGEQTGEGNLPEPSMLAGAGACALDEEEQKDTSSIVWTRSLSADDAPTDDAPTDDAPTDDAPTDEDKDYMMGNQTLIQAIEKCETLVDLEKTCKEFVSAGNDLIRTPDAKIKLEPVSPCKSKSKAREDSEPIVSNPAKRICLEQE